MSSKVKQVPSNNIENIYDGMGVSAMECFVLEITYKKKWLENIPGVDYLVEEILTTFIEISESFDEIKALGLKELLFGRNSPILPVPIKTYNLSQAARAMNISEKTLRKGINAGYFFGRKTGRIWMFTDAQIECNLIVLSQRK